jgi:hypothetical protein
MTFCVVGFVMAADAMSSASLMQWVKAIDGHICKDPLLSEVWWVGVLLWPQPQPSKLGLDHGRV